MRIATRTSVCPSVRLSVCLILCLSSSAELFAQGPAKLIHAIRYKDNDPKYDDARFALELVNIGDRGRVILNSGGTYVNSTEKDGHDDFALLILPFYDFQTARVWVYDGRTGKRYLDPSGAAPVEYTFPNTEFFALHTGMSGAGGKHLIGDTSYPDLAIGAPIANAGKGRVYILDMKLLDPNLGAGTPNRIIDNRNTDDGKFGSSVAILGQIGGGAAAEILVGAPDSGLGAPPSGPGRFYALDLEGMGGAVRTMAKVEAPGDPCFITPTYCDVVLDFGNALTGIGDIATKVAGVDAWGRDASTDFAVADPRWIRNTGAAGCISPIQQLYTGFYGWFNANQLFQGILPTVVVGYYCGPNDLGHLGAFMTHAGDQDLPGSPPAVTGSWDFMAGGKLNEDTVFTDPNNIAAGLPVNFLALPNLHPCFNASGAGGPNQSANQMCPVGDIDLNNVNDGNDDWAYVVSNPSNPQWHEVHVFDATQIFAVGDLYVMTMDPETGANFVGTLSRTTASQLGDVDGDGLDDLGVVTGVFANNQVHVLILAYGSTLYPSGLPIIPGKPRLQGNRVAQRGSRIMVSVDNCAPFATGTLYEDVVLQSPGIPECLSTRTVAGTAYSFTCDQNGEFYFVRDLTYTSTNPNETTLGTVWYYQARVTTSGPAACKLSNVWSLRIVDTSNPLDEFSGDS